jgi:hypothetical protein
MKVKCINVRNFRNLTLNQEYEVVGQSVDFYQVVNNSGNTARYSKEYFEVVEEEVVEEVGPVVELHVEDEDGVDDNDITFKIDIENSFHIITISLNDEKRVKIYCLEVAGNCGTWSVSGINSVMDAFGNDLFTDVMDKLMEFLTDETSKGCIVFSTNIDGNEDVVEWLDRKCSGNTGVFFNPNSSNDVAIWWFLINQDHQNEDEDTW